jgi:hypothetical protein
VELSAWQSRWHTRLTLHGLTLIVYGGAACACVWMFNLAVRSWLSAVNQSGDPLATARPTEALMFLPALLALAGIVVLAHTTADTAARRRFSLVVACATGLVLCIMLAQRSLSGTGSYYTGPVWMRLINIRDSAWWAFAALTPLCGGAALSLFAVAARNSGLLRLARWCSAAALWLPLAALAAIAAVEVYEALALSVLTSQAQAVQQTPRPRPGQILVPRPPVQAEWYWTIGVQFSRFLLYTFLIAGASAVWLAACILRLRIRDVTDPGR